MTRSRRSLLQTCAGTVGAGAIGSLAGCFGQQSGDGGGNGGDDTDGTSGDGDGDDGDGSSATGQGNDLWYAQRLPDPTALGDDHYSFAYTAMADLLAHTDDTGIAEPTAHEVEGISFSAVTHVLLIGQEGAAVPSIFYYAGSFDPSEYVERGGNLRGVVEQGERHGLALWGPEADGAYAVGAGEGTLVQAHDPDGDPLEAVTAVLDATEGETARYAEVDADCRRLVDALGSGTAVRGRRHEPTDDLPDLVGEGVALTLGEAEARAQASFVFADEASVSPDDAASWAALGWAFDEPTAAAVQTDGPVATVDRTLALGEVEQAELDLPALVAAREERERAVPEAIFEFEYDAAEGTDRDARDGRLTVSHAGGDEIRADRLVLDGPGIADGGDVDQTESGSWQGSTGGEIAGQPAVSAGDSVTVAVTEDYVIRVVYEGETVARELARHEGPGA